MLLEEQQHRKNWLKFGALVVHKGLLKGKTIRFFLDALSSSQIKEIPFKNRSIAPTLIINNE